MARYNSGEDRWSYATVSRDMVRFFGKNKEVNGRAKNLGMGQSTIYSYATCKWASSQDSLSRFETRLRSWLDHREGGGKVADIDESVTAAKLVNYGLLEADRSKKFVVIVGPSGMGKSLLARHFANARTRGGMILVESYDGIRPRAFLASICRALGESDTGSLDAVIRQVAGSLAEKPRLVAIDEANFLTAQSINHLVYIWNQANMGIALMGTSELDRVLKLTDFQRVRSRSRQLIILPGLSEEEITKRLEENFDKKEITARVKELARNGSFESYRDLDTLIEAAADELDRNEGKSLEQVFERIHTRTKGKSKSRR
jgi:DNA transposition AAA+ family ATPase